MTASHPRLLLLVVGVLMVIAFVQPLVWAQPSLDSEEQAVYELINNYRAQQGLPSLALSSTLDQAADAHSSWMANQDCFSHQCSGESDYVQRMWNAGYPNVANGYGENIAAGQATAAEVFNDWQNSSGHNKNMLNSSWRAIGIARVYSPNSQYGWYWTTDFGTIDDSGSPPPPGELAILDNPDLPLPMKQNISYWFKAQGGTAPYIWNVSGRLPAGLKLRTCGELKGRARKVGDYTVNIIVKDKTGTRTTKAFTLSVQNSVNGSFELVWKPAAPQALTNIALFDLSGKLLKNSAQLSASLPELTEQLTNGVYLAIIVTRNSAGQVIRRELKKIVVKH
ncbi:hypothetical protein HYR54_14675 [Candidatus Acetothermia bacterium]|nr:hypothetical protein [Candidatus Acetothermia bacterium]